MSNPISPGPEEETSRFLREITEASRAGDHLRARQLAGSALDRGLRHSLFFSVRAGWFAQQGRYHEVLADLEAARSLTPDDPVLLVKIGSCLLRVRRPQDALAILNAAVAAKPDFAQAHYERGVALGALSQVEEMRSAHERTVAIQPDHADALANLALLAAMSGNAANAREYGARALGRSPRHAPALAALAVAEILDGAFAAAQQRLASVLADRSAVADTRVDIALGVAAEAFDRRNRISQAFAAYTSMNERRRALQTATFESARSVEAVRRRTAYFTNCPHWTASEPATTAKDEPAGHVFLLGFMRSGTTLLETILASSPQVVALDEREFLADPARLFLFSDDGLDGLAALEDRELARWRHAYWNGVREAGAAVSGKVFVNKMPFNSLRLPLIARLFPDARILLALRDPRDVVFSCFRHRFDPSQQTFEFLRLEDCARFYAAVMELIELYRLKLPMGLREYRYEDTFANFSGAMRDVCNFIGIEWNESMRDFRAAAAGTIDPRSQSAPQVRKGLYTGAMGQWRRYRNQMAPVLPILQPWVERFGYPAD